MAAQMFVEPRKGAFELMHNATLAPSWRRGQGTFTFLLKGLAVIVLGIIWVYCDGYAVFVS